MPRGQVNPSRSRRMPIGRSDPSVAARSVAQRPVLGRGDREDALMATAATAQGRNAGPSRSRGRTLTSRRRLRATSSHRVVAIRTIAPALVPVKAIDSPESIHGAAAVA